MPFKIELRDLAKWLRGLNPWMAEGESSHGDVPTLEAALSAHVHRFSGGLSFSREDLAQIVKNMPVIIVLDALDEVADLDDRQAVVDEIEAATERLEQISLRLMTIVTSRPTALAKAPALDHGKFAYFTLREIHPGLAIVYSRKWASARSLGESDSADLIATLRSKLQSPHMADLAKNTMQLTILLSLLVARGSSLPDKRTELYTAYVDHFLNRESEKSSDVRDNREILLDIHGYLGYHLHAQAEGSGATGRIREAELKEVLRAYLQKDGQAMSMVDKLFNAVVDRVVALVPRIEGTFEFEVQPLREYFAARHLYHTAPYSPSWQDRKGTKPDRFDAMAANPYWMNVTRFFAGFYSKGELPDLALRLSDLIQAGRLTSYPRQLTLALLQDWVFSQSPRATELVIHALFDNLGLCWAVGLSLLPESPFYASRAQVHLSPRGGAEQAREIFWSYLVQRRVDVRTQTLCHLMSRVSSKVEYRPTLV